MSRHHLALVACGLLDLLTPALGIRLGHRQVGDDAVEDELEELLLVLDVPIDRAGADAELVGEPPHGEAGRAVSVEEAQRSLDDDVTAELDAFAGLARRTEPRSDRHLRLVARDCVDLGLDLGFHLT